MKCLQTIVTVLTLVAAACAAGASDMVMWAPARDQYPTQDPGGTSILPNGRTITPDGAMFRVRPHPYGLTMSKDGRWVVAVSSDGPQLSILDMKDPSAPEIFFIPNDQNEGEGVLDAAFMGLAIAPDNKTLYVAGGKDWSVTAFDLETREHLFRIDCAHDADGQNFRHGYAGDLRLSHDGKTLYVCDQSNFRMLILDTAQRAVVRSIPVGRYPFGIALSPKGDHAYVANVGMYEYSYFRTEDGEYAKLPFPPFGVPSKEAEEGVTIDGVVVSGLGDPNDIAGMSVWKIRISRSGKEKVVKKTKTGHLVGELLEDFPAVGGSSPNSIAATRSHVYVSNGSNDSISVIHARTGEREKDIDLILHPLAAKLRGMIPFGVALSPDHSMLYVAEAGVNAIGVIRLSDHKVLGHIPSAWFPSKLAVSPDGKRLYVACAKGVGSGPNAGPNHKEGDPTGIGALMRGYIHIINLPQSQDELDALTQRVIENNVVIKPVEALARPKNHPVPPVPGAWQSPVKHVIYVTKENRTYDEIFGAMPGGRGDAELCRLGRPIDVTNKDGTRTVKDVVLMPNHIALAKRFAM
ncbi:MAG TPA: beta-propeller fold lactonase family protein, partial [Candidatus Hydrogenedentes bacterium]|nr:beta-propeller fold lactonase family protein [Candidatus Hydrogenedentota bacterium]